MRGRKSLRLLLFGTGALVVAVIGVAAFISLGQGLSAGGIGTAASGQSSLPCSPRPCLDLRNFTMWVSNVREADGVVSMEVSFRNSSDATHADPADFQLIDAKNAASPAVQDPPSCSHWSRTEFANGAKLGPLTICFRPATTAAPLTLRWTPDMAFFCCQADLKIK
jgi:hypothetical protein